jgi:hypothetical protein
MNKQTSAKLIVNGVGVIAAAIVVGWTALSFFEDKSAKVCEGRYASSTRFALSDESGAALPISSLQARVGASEWGVLDNSRIIEGAEGSRSKHVLQVDLAKETGSGHKPSQTRGGVTFSWQPTEMQADAPSVACLTYQVFLPEDFAFASAGALPGLFFGKNFDSRGEPAIGSGAVARLGWNREGAMAVNLQYAGKDGWQNPVVLTSKTKWPLGRWVSVEEEIILNDVGKKDGVIRVWLDGELAGENAKLGLRSDPGLTMAGVLADVHFGTVSNASLAPKDLQIQLSPFVIRWQ